MINPRRACAARVTVLSLSVCVCACVCVCYLANSYAVNAQVQSKIRNALLKVYGVDFAKLECFVQKLRGYLLTSTNFDGFDGKEIHQKDYWRLLVG